MLGKLSLRNAKRSLKDYAVFIMTMVMISALIFAYNSLIFDLDIRETMFSEDYVALPVLIGIADFFVILIAAWLVNYMMKFMMKKRSREFAIYQLVGVPNKKISRLYVRESSILGIIAFIIGIGFGVVLQVILKTIFFSMMHLPWNTKISINWASLVLSFGIYLLVYLLALMKNSRQLKKMTIRKLLDMDQQNEVPGVKKHKVISIILFILSIGYFAVFFIMMFNLEWSLMGVVLSVSGLIVATYFFYIGVTGFLSSYIDSRGKKLFHGSNLFLSRQFTSKITTMQITFGTITVLMIVVLLNSSYAFMLNDYQDKMLESQLPFDFIMYDKSTDSNFEPYLSTIKKNVKVKEIYKYSIYQNGSDEVSQYMYRNYPYFKKHPNHKKSQNNAEGYQSYFDYDTYMKLSDYNKLRNMLNQGEVVLKDDEYMIQCKDKIEVYLKGFGNNNKVEINGNKMKFAGIETIPFSQSGHNGSDYIIIVPDDIALTMKPYYSIAAAEFNEKTPQDLQDKLEKLEEAKNDGLYSWYYGTDQIISVYSRIAVRDNLIGVVKFILFTLSYVLFYMSLTFLCIAFTVLAVQQLSDSSKYKFRYDILSRLGLNQQEIHRIVFKQIGIYYLVPFVLGVLLSGIVGIYISNIFIFYTGIHSSTFNYIGSSVLLFGGIYFLYFVITYVGFKRGLYSTLN